AEASVALPADAPFTQPYWLRERPARGSFVVSDESLLGRPENAPALTARVVISLAGRSLAYDAPVVYRWVDPVQGERYRPLDVVPPVTSRFDQAVYLFPDATPREVKLGVQAGDSAVSGVARLRLPAGWRAEPAEAPVTLAGGAEQALRFRVTPGNSASLMKAEIEVGGRVLDRRLQRIDYPHLPVQTLMPLAEAPAVRAGGRR